MENMRKINPYQFVVWTQSGFRKVVRVFKEQELGAGEVEGFPTKYPCVVTFRAEYRGYHYWFADCVPLTTAIVRARTFMDKLIAADDEHQAELTEEKSNDTKVVGSTTKG